MKKASDEERKELKLVVATPLKEKVGRGGRRGRQNHGIGDGGPYQSSPPAGAPVWSRSDEQIVAAVAAIFRFWWLGVRVCPIVECGVAGTSAEEAARTDSACLSPTRAGPHLGDRQRWADRAELSAEPRAC